MPKKFISIIIFLLILLASFFNHSNLLITNFNNTVNAKDSLDDEDKEEDEDKKESADDEDEDEDDDEDDKDDDNDEDEDKKDEFKTEERVTNEDGTVTRIKREFKNGEEKTRISTYNQNGIKIADKEIEVDKDQEEVKFKLFDQNGNKIEEKELKKEDDELEKFKVKTFNSNGIKLSDYRLETKDGKVIELRVRDSEGDSRIKYNPETGEVRVNTKNISVNLEDENEIEEVLETELEENEIEVEFENGIAKVKTKLNGIENEYTINSSDTEEVYSIISEKTGLSLDEVKSIVKFEDASKDTVKISAKGNGFEITKGDNTALLNFPITIDEETGDLFVQTRTGEIKLPQMPDTIVQKAKGSLTKIGNVEIEEENEELKYFVEGEKQAKLLGLFNTNISLTQVFNAQNGELEKEIKSTLDSILDFLSF